MIIPGLLLFGVEAPPPPPPPITVEMQLEIQMEKQKESEAKFEAMITELQQSVDYNKEFVDSASTQMANLDKRLLQLGLAAGKKVQEIEQKFSAKQLESHEAIVNTQQYVVELGTSQERERESERDRATLARERERASDEKDKRIANIGSDIGCLQQQIGTKVQESEMRLTAKMSESHEALVRSQESERVS